MGILVHHVLHIWETQLSEGRRSPDHWEVLFLGGRHLGAFVPSRSISSAINRFIWPSSAMPPGSLPRRSQHSRTVPTKIIDAIGSPDLLCCRGCHGFASMYGGACSAKGKAPTKGEGTIHPRGDLRQTLELHAVSGPSIIQGNVLGV